MSLADTTTRALGVDVAIYKVVHETADAVSIIFDIDPRADTRFDYTPGQFLTLQIPSEQTESVARCYSLASSPVVDSRLKVTVKRTPDGYASNWLCDNAKPGMAVHVLPPAGSFTATTLDQDLVLFAGGSGITPVISILKTALVTSDIDLALFYANRDRSSVIFDEELRLLEAKYPDRLHIEHWIEEERGLPTPEQLRQFSAPLSTRPAFICGPGPFMSAVENILVGLGARKHHVHVERFVSLSGDPFTLHVTDIDSTQESATATVSLDGAQHTLDWPSQSTLIDVLLSAGIDAPYSCREGECGSCACILRSGTVSPGNITALTAEDVNDGYILACQAKPTSRELDIEF